MTEANPISPGYENAAFMCIHTVLAIDSGERVGFFFDEADLPPLAWCYACEQVRLREEAIDPEKNWMKGRGFKCVCRSCYDIAKKRLYPQGDGAELSTSKP